MSEIRHIVYDIGKVLIHYDPDIPFSRIIPDPVERRWFFDTVCTSEWNIEQDRGRTWQEAEALLVAEFPEHESKIRAFRQHWHEMVPHAYDDSVALMEGLVDAGHDVTMLTNWASDTFREARGRFPFLERPRGVTVSGDVGLIKPDRRIYDLHVASFGLDPKAALFIDDSQKNVNAAIEAGWQAVLFTNAKTLEADLERLGIGR
ncbi:HAD family hydrolase [Aminobacter niigataensis]|uniref:2-haloacid dehalogenase n=1 Tax=Aminobacter niigataensis TaxID=83265 RepID=A0ABR6L596_9HYPH|nr:HAD family phosphatase [Aminobacter niigataensis]MBB4651938.1 2-haloacid dehalogenase [Aminobacter niigataensis]CAI2935781.1 Hydrolase, haloacid dehalogenase-like family [Aminobacter niigataensis]